MTHWLLSNTNWLIFIALFAGIVACAIAVFRQPRGHNVMWLVGLGSWLIPFVIDILVRREIQPGDFFPSWYLPTTMGLRALGTLAIVAGAVMLALHRPVHSGDNNTLEHIGGEPPQAQG